MSLACSILANLWGLLGYGYSYTVLGMDVQRRCSIYAFSFLVLNFDDSCNNMYTTTGKYMAQISMQLAKYLIATLHGPRAGYSSFCIFEHFYYWHRGCSSEAGLFRSYLPILA